jgi:hypothetical protein
MSLPLLRERVQELDRDIEDVRSAMQEERGKLRLLKNMKDIEARLAKLETQRATIEQEMAGIEEKEDAILNPSNHSINVRDLLIWNRVDKIIETQDILILKKAIAQATAMSSQGGYGGIKNQEKKDPVLRYKYCGHCNTNQKFHFHFYDSEGDPIKVWPEEFDTIIKVLKAEYAQLSSQQTQLAENPKTLAERLDRNEVYQRLKAKRDSLLEEITEVKSDLAALGVYMQEWAVLIEKDRNEERQEEQQARDQEFNKVRKVTDAVGGLGAGAGLLFMALADLSTGGIITGGSLAVALIQRARRKKVKADPLTKEELSSCARVLCESKIRRLEENLLELGEQKNEALEHLQQEEQEIRNGNDE